MDLAAQARFLSFSNAESLGSFPLTVTVITMGYRSYKNPLNKAALRTVTGRGNDPTNPPSSNGGRLRV